MDWLFVRVNLKKKKAILFNFFFCCQKFKQIWESGALVLREALPGCCVNECFI